MKAIINARIYDYELYIDCGYIIFDEQIVEVGPMADYSGHHEVYDAKGKLVMPGLVNGHTHIYSTLFRGAPMDVSPNDFMDVLELVWWHFDSKLDLESIEASAYHYGRDSLSMGITTLVDHHASGLIENSLGTIRRCLTDMGIKSLVCFESSDRFNLDDCLKEHRYALDHKGYIGMHASLSLSDKSLSQLSKLEGPIHIHVGESKIDEDKCLSQYNERVVERLNRYNLLRPNSILAHCVHINEAEAALIKDHDCYIAINPESNMNNAVGLYNFSLIEKLDLNVLVGTDGLGSNMAKAWQNFYYIGKMQKNHPSGMSLDFVKRKIIESYEYYSKRLSCFIGRIEQEYASDFIIIDYHNMTPINAENIFSHVLFGVYEALKPYAVFTDGTLRIDQYSPIEPEKSYEEVIHNLWRRL